MALDLTALDDSPVAAPAAAQAAPSPVVPKAPREQFEEDPDNPRFEFDDPDFEDFVADVAERGILQPIVVRPVNGKLRIRFGARRYRAGCRLNLAELPYVITEDERQFDDYAQVAENERRKSLQPLELATFIKKKLDAGDKKKEVAAKLKIDASAVTHLMSLIDAPAFLLELYHSRKCRAPHYLYELRKLHDKNAEIVERRCAEADEIDRRLLVAIAEEIEPKTFAPAAGPTDIRDVLDSQSTGGGGGSGSGGGGHQAGDAGEDSAATGHDDQAGGEDGAESGPSVQHLPSHNPEIEGGGETKPTDPNKLKKPLLLGTYQGREVMIVLNKRPTTAGLVFVKYEDGSGEDEVTIGEVTMTMLTDSHA